MWLRISENNISLNPFPAHIFLMVMNTKKLKMAFNPLGFEIPIYAAILGAGITSKEPIWGAAGVAACYVLWGLIKYDLISQYKEKENTINELKTEQNSRKGWHNHTLDYILTNDIPNFYDKLFYKMKSL